MLNYAFDSLIKIRINYLINLTISQPVKYFPNIILSVDSTLDGCSCFLMRIVAENVQRNGLLHVIYNPFKSNF